jgi:hypothetical protein
MKKITISGDGDPLIFDKSHDFFTKSHTTHILPVGSFFMERFKCCPCVYNSSFQYSFNAVEIIKEKGKLISDWIFVPNELSKGASGYVDDGGLTWEEDGDAQYRGTYLYKENIVIEIEMAEQRSVNNTKEQYYVLRFYHPPGVRPPLEDFEEFIYKPNYKAVIHTIIKTASGFNFEPFEVVLPETYDITTHYEPELEKVHDEIVEELNKNKSGLYLFHGDPGTGKTTYIKYLSSVVKRNMIYVPTNFIDAIVDPSFLPALLDKKSSILIIEDAEKALLQREGGDQSSLVSTILNLTDGMMGDIFNISIIATYNNPRHELDQALLRKGRLKKEYQFDKLSVKTAQKLVKKMKLKVKVTEPMSLAEIYNAEVENVHGDVKSEKRIIGFSVE